MSTDNRSQTSAKNGIKGGRPAHQFFVVAAPGYYGDKTTVSSTHSTAELAKKACGNTECVRSGEMKKGAKFLRVYEEIHPIVK